MPTEVACGGALGFQGGRQAHKGLPDVLFRYRTGKGNIEYTSVQSIRDQLLSMKVPCFGEITMPLVRCSRG